MMKKDDGDHSFFQRGELRTEIALVCKDREERKACDPHSSDYNNVSTGVTKHLELEEITPKFLLCFFFFFKLL